MTSGHKVVVVTQISLKDKRRRLVRQHATEEEDEASVFDISGEQHTTEGKNVPETQELKNEESDKCDEKEHPSKKDGDFLHTELDETKENYKTSFNLSGTHVLDTEYSINPLDDNPDIKTRICHNSVDDRNHDKVPIKPKRRHITYKTQGGTINSEKYRSNDALLTCKYPRHEKLRRRSIQTNGSIGLVSRKVTSSLDDLLAPEQASLHSPTTSTKELCELHALSLAKEGLAQPCTLAAGDTLDRGGGHCQHCCVVQ